MIDASRLQALLDDPRTVRLFDALTAPGEETRIIGGAVRNGLLDLPVADLDFATTLTPDIVMNLAEKAGLRALPTGLAHGTATVLINGAPFEVTTLREDLETNGRHARVRFGRNFEADAWRRDFTINALSLSRDGRLHDYVGGLLDLVARRVRFIGDPLQRIREDYLRILRFFRFSAAYGLGEMDRDGLRAAIFERQGLQFLSAERIRMEIFKLFCAPRAPAMSEILSDCGLLAFSLGGVAYPQRLAKCAHFEHTCAEPPDPVVRLMAYSVRIQEDADRLRDRLRLSNAEYFRIAKATQISERLLGEAPPSGARLAELTFARGAEAARDGVTLAFLDSGASVSDGQWREAMREANLYANLRLPITGDDLKKRGLVTGPSIGVALKNLQARWIRAGFPNDPKILSHLIDEVLEHNSSNEMHV